MRLVFVKVEELECGKDLADLEVLLDRQKVARWLVV